MLIMAHAIRNGLVGLLGGIAAAIAPVGSDYITPTAYAQAAGEKTNGGMPLPRPQLTEVSHSSYRQIIDSNESVFVMYTTNLPSSDPVYQVRADAFTKWVQTTFGTSIAEKIAVNLPNNGKEITREGLIILEREAGKNPNGDYVWPSMVFYKNGKPMVRLRGPPEIEDEGFYKQIEEALVKKGFVKITSSR